jgi:lipoprotein NlpD
MKLPQRCFCLTAILMALVVSTLTACSHVTRWNPDDYTVKSGDTLYSIAWRYELDTEDFASWNHISLSAPIKPGQRLHTRKPANFKAPRSAARAQAISSTTASWPQAVPATGRVPEQKWVKARKGDSLYGLSRRYSIDVKRLAQLNQLAPPYVIQPGQTIFLKPLAKIDNNRVAKNRATKSSASGTSQRTRSSRATISSQSHWPGKVRWQRPAKGKIVKKFNYQKSNAKGIDIAGKQGSAIVAAADGKVVYSGNGLISYGNLIIIKHNKTFLSAYAYNRKLLVKEGDRVRAGQQVAEMGSKNKAHPLLHFEIRKNGKPVNPLKYLPW